jgi:hypothetical protein
MYRDTHFRTAVSQTEAPIGYSCPLNTIQKLSPSELTYSAVARRKYSIKRGTLFCSVYYYYYLLG